MSADFLPDSFVKDVLLELGFIRHLESFSKGMIDSADVLWFALFTFGFLFLTWRSIESQRWR